MVAGLARWLDSALGGPALVDAPLPPGPHARRFALDATLGVTGLPGTATGQASLVTGRNAAHAMGRHMQAYPGPRLRAWIDAVGTLFARTAAAGRTGALLTTYPEGGRETALRYAARVGGAVLAPGGPGPLAALGPHLGLGRSGAPADDEAAAKRSATLAARLASPYDLAVVETDLCDRAGHLREGREGAVVRAVRYLDVFLERLRLEMRADDLLVVASDHGNAEDTRSRGHTRARVGVFVLGSAGATSLALPAHGDLTAFAPWLEALVAGREGGG